MKNKRTSSEIQNSIHRKETSNKELNKEENEWLKEHSLEHVVEEDL